MTSSSRLLQQGFSLIELVTVLLIITVLSTIAIRSTVDIGYSARFEQTRERLNSLRQAIVGNPKRSINGQPDISGFVADMGRLPRNIRELIDFNGYCLDDNQWDNKTDCEDISKGNSTWITLCSDNTYTDKINCETNNAEWLGWKTYGYCNGDLSIDDEETCNVSNIWVPYLYGGWRGPYLSISENADDNDGYTDGWGRESIDNNYGWVLTYTGGTPYQNLEIKSFGKNGSADVGIDCGDDEYNGDCSTLMEDNDYIIDISSIFVTFRKNLGSGITTIPPVSFCSDPATTNNVDRASCEAVPATWNGGCYKQGYFNKADCENAVLGNSTWYECSDKTSLNEASCINNSAIWYGTTGYNTDTWTKTYIPNSYPNKNICMIIFYRKDDGTTGFFQSDDNTATAALDPVQISETGTFQTIEFKFDSDLGVGFVPIEVPVGHNAIGIYENDGDCNPDNTLYPSDRKVINVLFMPRTTTSLTNW